MTSRLWLKIGSLACLAALGCVAISLAGERASDAQASDAQASDKAASKPAELQQNDKVPPVPTATARDRAKLMHNIYAATLEVMHHRYFHEDRATVPARALEDVFSEIDEQSNIKARWISVNTKAMSIDHQPRDAFERKAAAEISAGKPEFEQIENGVYRRAAAIPLAAGCVGCHSGHFAPPPKSPRFAGLIISIPISEK